jgi:hypothetical protein
LNINGLIIGFGGDQDWENGGGSAVFCRILFIVFILTFVGFCRFLSEFWFFQAFYVEGLFRD